MSHTYRVAIQSTRPDHQWIDAFVDELVTKGADIRDIAWFNFFFLHGRDFHRASRQYDEAEKTAQCVCLPLVAPHLHKHYLRSVAQLATTLGKDHRTIVVYDLSELHEGCQSEEHVVTTMSVDMVIRFLMEEHGEQRVLDRAQALERLGHMLCGAPA